MPDAPASGTLSLHHTDGSAQDLTVVHPTEGAPGVDISRLLSKGGLVTYDPGFVNTAICSSDDHLHRRRRRHPALPRLPDRPARRARPASPRSATC